MKEDYLWNKIGHDSEIEQLESALKAFRYQESAPPDLPAKIIPFETKSSRRFFRLALAFGSLACLLLICFGVWFQFSDQNIDTAEVSPKIIAPPINKNSANLLTAEKKSNPVNEKAETPKQSIEREAVKAGKIFSPTNRHSNSAAQKRKIEKPDSSVARNAEVKKHSDKLTKEETYAYNQLMLALSITGSKLKLVKDKIDGVEEKNAVFENGR